MIGYTTVSRTKILEYLKENANRTVSVQDIDAFLKDSGIEVNLTTIYRYLDRLTKEGQVLKYVSESGAAVYEFVDPDHHCDEHLHLKCLRCGAVIHLDCGFMSEIADHIEREHGFKIRCKNSIIYGTCKKCAETIAARENDRA